MFYIFKSGLGGFKNKDPGKTNKILLDNLQSHLLLMHDSEINISEEESIKFTKLIIERHKSKAPISLNTCK